MRPNGMANKTPESANDTLLFRRIGEEVRPTGKTRMSDPAGSLSADVRYKITPSTLAKRNRSIVPNAGTSAAGPVISTPDVGHRNRESNRIHDKHEAQERQYHGAGHAVLGPVSCVETEEARCKEERADAVHRINEPEGGDAPISERPR